MAGDIAVVQSGSPWIVSRSVLIAATPEEIFEVLADPRQHARFDGSGTVRGSVTGPARLGLGDSFRMEMRMGVPYRIASTVREFQEGRLIAWSHMGGHRWRYELQPEQGRTRVTETFDGTYAISPRALRVIDAYGRNGRGIEQSLRRLKTLMEEGT